MNAELEKWIEENGLQFVETMGGFGEKLSASKSCKYPFAEYVNVDNLRALFAGKVLVPVEATQEMIEAADKVDFTNEDTEASIINMWQAMLAAA